MAARILVTGAGGLIGRALVRDLVARGFSVGAMGRAGVGPPGAQSFAVASYDVAAVTAALAGARFDVVVHLAAYGVRPDDRDLATMRRVNVDGPAAMAEVAAAHGARGFVHCGSSAEYRAAARGTRIREDHPLETKALYGASKAAGGLIGSATAQALGLPFLWLRIFGVIGPGEASHRLIPSIAAKLARGEPAALSPGDQTRDFLALDDVVRGIVIAAQAAMGGASGICNLCSGRPVTVREVALATADALGRPRSLLDFGRLPYRPEENMWLLGDGDAFRQLAGFAPALGLHDMIAAALREHAVQRTEQPA